VKPAGANVRCCSAFWFPDPGSTDARSEGAGMPSVDDYAGSHIFRNVNDPEETHVLANAVTLGCGRSLRQVFTAGWLTPLLRGELQSEHHSADTLAFLSR